MAADQACRKGPGRGIRRRSSEAMLMSLREIEIQTLRAENLQLTSLNQRLLCAVTLLGLLLAWQLRS